MGSVIGRGALIAGCAAAVPLIAFTAPAVAAIQSAEAHALLDLAIALTALVCGLKALVRYESERQSLFLWLGAGLLASGAIDMLHLGIGLGALVAPGRDPVVWTWTLGMTALAGGFVLGFARSSEDPRHARREALIAAAATAVVMVVLATTLANGALPAAVLPEFPLHRPYEVVPALMLVGAIGLALRGRTTLDPLLRVHFDLALALYLGAEAGAAAWAQQLGAINGVAHAAKLAAHVLVFVGLLRSSARLLVAAEDARVRMATQAVQLEASERHIRSIVDHAPYAILSADAAGIVRNVNPIAEEMFGIADGQAVGRPLHSFFDAALQAELAATLGPGEQSLRARFVQIRQSQGEAENDRSRRALSRQTRGIRGNGETFPVALTLTDTVAGGNRFVTAFVRDLTRTLEQEQRTHQALTLATQILDQSSVAIVSTDASGLITRFNRTAQQWLGYTEQEACGHLGPGAFIDRTELDNQAQRLRRDHGVAAVSDSEIVLILARRTGADRHEWTLVRKDGSRFPASISITPLFAESGGDVTGFVLVVTDLSQQKEVENLKNEFVSTVSHELRTPLTSVRGALGLLGGGTAGKLPPQAQGLLDIAQRNTERLILLINDILDIEKIEAGKLRFNLKSFDLDALVGDAVQSATGLAATRRVQLVRRTRHPGLRVHADDQRLLQVMSNLLSNAIKFSPEGGVIEIDVGVAGERARVTVTDHGAGIPLASQPRIFQKFFQADSSSARAKSGSGLGLSICKALIDHMDGYIGFRSQPGETMFYFSLARDLVSGVGERSGRVLVVEHDPDAAAVLCHILRQAGFETETAPTARAARDALDKGAYHAMLLDMLLPDQNAMAFLIDLRRQDRGRHLPVLVVSTYEPDAATQAAAYAARVSDWLTKPIDSARLQAAIRKALGAGDVAGPGKPVESTGTWDARP